MNNKRKWLILVFMIIFHTSAYGMEYIDLKKIAAIESSNNPKAYNKYSKARGLYQITPICLKDYNLCNKKKYREEDLFNPEVNTAIAKWYFNIRIPQLLKAKKQNITTTNILVAYNAGIRSVGKWNLPKETRNYIKKYGK